MEIKTTRATTIGYTLRINHSICLTFHLRKIKLANIGKSASPELSMAKTSTLAVVHTIHSNGLVKHMSSMNIILTRLVYGTYILIITVR